MSLERQFWKLRDCGGGAVSPLSLKKLSSPKQSLGMCNSPSCNLLLPVLFGAKISKPAR